ncbi:MAG: alginate export family protein [Vicingaceae bacterium]|nr:alginate export family protein [Vicingaceae bacterium]
MNLSKKLVFGMFLSVSVSLTAQTPVNLTDILIQKGIITQREVDSIAVTSAFNEKENIQNKSFIIGLDFRPRAEFRDGYRTLPNDTTSPAFFVSNRSRLLFTYQSKGFIFHTSIQDVRVWGAEGQFSKGSNLGIFEAYVEPSLNENFSVRIGRQKLDIDNNRLFSPANWSQFSRAHEGVRLFYNSEKLSTDVMGAFSQAKENVFETDFTSPTNNYKLMAFHHLTYKLTKNIQLMTINVVDGYEHKTNPDVLYLRATSGGRFTFTKNDFIFTTAAYYQYGNDLSGAEIDAFYVQPEIKYKWFGKLTSTIGAEIQSGDDAKNPDNIYNSFVPLFGVAHRFMGNMDYFTSFPKDVKNGGLVNPYLFLNYQLNKKLSIRVDGHLFYTQNKVVDTKGDVIDSYLGFENDFSFKYKFNEYTTLDVGFSYLLAEKSMETLKGGDSDNPALWSMCMITFKPELFNYKKL